MIDFYVVFIILFDVFIIKFYKKMRKQDKVMFYISIVSAIIVGIIILFFDKSNYVVIQWLRIIFGSIFILFIPGYWITRNFFEKNEIDFLERFALSFALSISVVPLLTFYLNLIGLKINSLNVYLICLGIILINLFYLHFFKNKKIVKNEV